MKFIKKILQHKPVAYVLFLSAACLSAITHAALVVNHPINVNESYDAPGGGDWSVWASRTGSTVELITNWTDVEDATGNGGGAYVLETLMSDTPVSPEASYFYLQLPSSFPLYGDINLSGKLKVEVIDANNASWSMSFGTSVDLLSFGVGGMTINPYGVVTTDPGWQTLGGNLNDQMLGKRESLSKWYTLSTAEDILPTARGPVLYIYKKRLDSSLDSSLRLRIYVDDVSITGTTVEPAAYDIEAGNRRTQYNQRMTDAIATMDASVNNAMASVNATPIPGRPLIYSEVVSQASTFSNDYSLIQTAYTNEIIAYSNRIGFPEPSQYEEMLALSHSLTSIAALTQVIIDNPDKNILTYPVDASKKHPYQDHVLEKKGENIDTVVSSTIALKEFEPVSFFVQNINDSAIEITQLDFANISNQFGQSFPVDNIDIRTVKQWYTQSTNTIGVISSGGYPFNPILAPEVLLHDDTLISVDRVSKKNFLHVQSAGSTLAQDITDPTILMPHDATVDDAATFQPFSLPAYNSRQFWITINANNNLLPGVYSGNAKVHYIITDTGAPESKLIPIQFTILPLTLPDSDFDYGIYYRAKISPYTGFLAEYKSENQYTAEMLNMLEHGVKYPTQYLTSTAASLDEVSLYYGIRETVGLPCDKAFMLGGMAAVGEGSVADVSANARSLIDHYASFSDCQNTLIYMYGSDEAKGSLLTAQRELWESAHAEGAKVYVAGYVGAFDLVGDLLDTIVYSGKANDSEINQWRGNNKDVYSYGNPQTGVADAGLYRKNYGLYLWQHNYTGAMDYAYQDAFPSRVNLREPDASGTIRWDLSNGLCFSYQPEGYCTAWNDFDNTTYFDHMFTYPTTNGVVDTVQWEGFREGVDDTRYLAALQQLLTANPTVTVYSEAQQWLTTSRLDPDFDPIAVRAGMQAYITQILTEINSDPVISNVQVTATNSTVTISGHVDDADNNFAAMYVLLNAATKQVIAPGPFTHTFNNVSLGNHTIQITAHDYMGGIATYNTSIIFADTDNDGYIDLVDNCPDLSNPDQLNTDGDSLGDVCDPDIDGDGLINVIEDANGNGIVDLGETNWLLADSDRDGLSDGQEDSNLNGIVDLLESDPLNPDSDDDGLTDGYEINVAGTNPGTLDAVYTYATLPSPGDMNGDGVINIADMLLLQRMILGL